MWLVHISRTENCWLQSADKADIEFWLCWLAMRCWVNHFSGFGFSSFKNHTQKLKSPLFDIIHQTYGLNITGFDPSLTLPVTKKRFFFLLCLVTQSCLTPCDPMDYSPPGLCPWGFPRQEYWSGLPCSPPGYLPSPGIKPTSPTLQAESLSS